MVDREKVQGDLSAICIEHLVMYSSVVRGKSLLVLLQLTTSFPFFTNAFKNCSSFLFLCKLVYYSHLGEGKKSFYSDLLFGMWFGVLKTPKKKAHRLFPIVEFSVKSLQVLMLFCL